MRKPAETRSVPEMTANSWNTGASDYPPGTVLLEKLSANPRRVAGILLQPQPSDDPNDPLNWSLTRKYANFFLTASYTTMIVALLNISPVIWQDYNADLGISYADLNNAFAINCAGLALGCIVFVPFAIKFGRRPVYIVSIFITFLTAIWQAALHDYPNMLATQVISGLSGAVADTLIQMTIADIFFLHERGTLNALYLLFFNSGAFMSPIVAGVVADHQGWRWVYWWCAIFLGICTVLFVFFYEETKYTAPVIGISTAPYVLDDENAMATTVDEQDGQVKENKECGEPLTILCTRTLDPTISPKRYRERMAFTSTTPGDLKSFLPHFYRPLILCCLFPAVAYTSIQYGAFLSWYSVVVTTQSTYFSQAPYNFDATGIGLLNLAPFVGTIFGVLYSGPLNDWSIRVFAKRNNGLFEPEMRLYTAVIPTLALPAGIFLYGYTTANGDPWIIPCIGAALVGFGNIAIAGLSLTYMVDCYQGIVGDALVGVCFVRNAIATGVVFAINPWIGSLGFYNTMTSVGCLALGIGMLWIPMVIWGKKMRIKFASRYQRYSVE